VNAAARERIVYKPKTIGTRPCDYCGQEFGYNKKKNLHCSPECSAATINKRNWKHLQARRARLKEAYVESFHAKEIYERDNWTCGICDEPIDPASKLPDRMSASIDHIIPISKGGTHERANVQAAHLHCNVSKGAKLAA
jgi:5-methylcytosine-specific restriction endonuclease McrA